MKGQSIFIDNVETIKQLGYVATYSNDNQEFLLVLDIYKEHGYLATKKALSTSPYTKAELSEFTGKQALTINGWVDITSCLPLHGSDRWAILFADEPTELRVYDNSGYNCDKRIYMVRDKPSKPSKKKSKTMSELIENTQSDLMTESDFPFQSKD